LPKGRKHAKGFERRGNQATLAPEGEGGGTDLVDKNGDHQGRVTAPGVKEGRKERGRWRVLPGGGQSLPLPIKMVL